MIQYYSIPFVAYRRKKGYTTVQQPAAPPANNPARQIRAFDLASYIHKVLYIHVQGHIKET